MKGLLLGFLCFIGCIGSAAEESLIETKNIPINYLNEVTVKFPAQVIIQQGNKNEYYIKGNDVSVKELKVSAHGGELIFEKKELQIGPTNIDNITIYITVKNLLKLNTQGDVSLDLKGISGDKLALNIQGQSHIKGDLTLKEFNANLIGNAFVNFKGRVQRQEVMGKGNINYDASALASNDTELNIQGSGEVRVKASQSLSAVIAGPITVFYSGNPKKVESNITGLGVLRKN